MKRISLLLVYIAAFGFTFNVSAQKAPKGAITKVKETKQEVRYTGMEAFEGEYVPSAHSLMYEQYLATGAEAVNQETWIGFTSYDLQTNAAPKHRLHGNSAGELAAVWTYHPETADVATTFPNRGSGYNSFNGGWGGFPSARLENTTRTGWCNVVKTSTGRELVISHSAANEIIILTKDAGATNFTETVLPTAAPPGLLWPNAIVSGNTIHVIALTTPEGNGGAAYNGQDGALLYFRSSDGGDTWDIQDYQVPGIGAADFLDLDGDSYSLAANGDWVAFTIFNGWGDVVTCISNDNGNDGSWSKRTVNDFPLDNYVTDTGYTLADIGGFDPDAPDSLAISTSDGSGSCYLDADGTVHVAYGQMYLLDDDLTDGNTSFFPGTSGINYWNSDMADDSAVLIQEVFDAIDINGNDTLEAGEDLSNYGGGLTSMVDIVTSNDGTIVMAYSQHMENYVREAVTGSANFPESQNYRHIYVTASIDNGATWAVPYDVTNPEVLFFPALLPQTEAVFPHLYTDGSDIINVTYQMDEEPGIFVYNANGADNDPITSNTIAHWQFDKTNPDIFVYATTSVDVAPVETFKFNVSPNPAFENVNISYDLPVAAQTQLVVTNVVGQQVLADNFGKQAAGEHNLNLDVSNLAKGMYIISLRSDEKVSSQKLIVK